MLTGENINLNDGMMPKKEQYKKNYPVETGKIMREKYENGLIPTFDIDAKLFLRDQQSLVASALTFVVFSIRRLPLLELSFESHLKFRHA